ncbi:response regulator transcription factor [Demequina lutea]|uniref:DNA-binding response OmpR family regulator n=1 Tax=Demequina lutea TaxID=431489 RepID=A0A7Y9Z965_9MICO|nr:response regulator transcription factor [Demequina lutea]NYI40308.1 DNA-binding response OmpR family regulator [Demequina lutea]
MSSPSNQAPRALVVDDERELALLIADYLVRDGFVTQTVFDGPSAIAAAREDPPDLVVLDLGLPGLDGVEVCRQIRSFSDCYIMMVTARSDEIDTILGLEVGADDYVTKPFSPRELAARARAMLRRPREGSEPSGPQGGVAKFGGLMIDLVAREASVNGAPVGLTKTEFDILAALASRPRQVFTRRTLIAAVWGEGWFGDEHIVDVHILHIRRKLGDDATTQRYVRTYPAVGYRMGEG